MAQTVSRQALYDLVWSMPLKQLCERFGISDVALKKTCARADIPTPERGYWARREAGKTVLQIALPLRSPGMDNDVVVGGGAYRRQTAWTKEELLGPLPSAPEFPEPLEAVRERVKKSIGSISVPRELRSLHPAIDRLLRADDQRRKKQIESGYSFSWDNPIFESPIERRRLRILNALFLAVARANGKSDIRGREAREIFVSFYNQHVNITLDVPAKPISRHRQVSIPQGDAGETKLRLAIMDGWHTEKVHRSWSDDGAGRLEAKIAEVAVEIAALAEMRYRESAVRLHEWRLERKAQLEEEMRKQKIEAERAERERLRRLEQARVDRLLKDAADFKQALHIREFVENACAAAIERGIASESEVAIWAEWALAQADRIDPVRSASFLKSMNDVDD